MKKKLKKIEKFYRKKGDHTSAIHIMLALDIVEDYNFNCKKKK